MTTERDDAWRLRPYIALTLAGWLVMLGIQIGSFVALKARVDDVSKQLTENTITRHEHTDLLQLEQRDHEEVNDIQARLLVVERQIRGLR